MAHVTVVGAGAVGSAIADRLSIEGHSVTVIAREIAGSFETSGAFTTPKAAGIGCIFKPSSPLVGKLVMDSYEDWMSLARDQEWRSVMETQLKIVTEPNESISYATQVEDFRRLNETSAEYRTYSFNPSLLIAERCERMRERGVQFQIRDVTPDEIKCLREGVPLEGSDYTVEALGLAARDLHPELGLYPIAGLLVHYIDPVTKELCDSYMHEGKAVYVVTRPSAYGREIVLGGTFLEHVPDLSTAERLRWKDKILRQVNEEFSELGFDMRRLGNTHRDITVGLRPGRVGDPVIKEIGKVSIVTGFGGQGLVTNPAVAKIVAERIGPAAAEFFAGISLPAPQSV